MGLFKEHTDDEQAHGLAAYLPNGRLWVAKHIPASNLRNLLIGLGRELTRVEQKQNEICNEADIAQASALITEWEKLLGIPDATIPIGATLTDRRNNVLFKLSVFGASKAVDYVRIANVLGYNVTVGPADGGGDMPATAIEKRYVIIVTVVGTSTTWPWTWPIVWGGVNLDALKAIFAKIKPAVCTIVYRP